MGMGRKESMSRESTPSTPSKKKDFISFIPFHLEI